MARTWLYWHADTLAPKGAHCSAIGRRSVDCRVLLDFCFIVSFNLVEQITLFKWPTRTHESRNTAIFFNSGLTTISHLQYPRDLSRYAPSLNFLFYHWSMYWASHNIVPQHIESTILRLSNYWSQADAVQSLTVLPSICHWYCSTLVYLVLIISRWLGWTNMQLLKCNVFVSV